MWCVAVFVRTVDYTTVNYASLMRASGFLLSDFQKFSCSKLTAVLCLSYALSEFIEWRGILVILTISLHNLSQAFVLLKYMFNDVW